MSIVDVHKLYFVKLGLKLLLRLKRHTRRSKDALRLCLFPHKAEERRWHKERVIFWGCRTSSINKTLPTTVTPTHGQKLTLCIQHQPEINSFKKKNQTYGLIQVKKKEAKSFIPAASKGAGQTMTKQLTQHYKKETSKGPYWTSAF